MPKIGSRGAISTALNIVADKDMEFLRKLKRRKLPGCPDFSGPQTQLDKHACQKLWNS
jgi:hypothetical protein